MGEHLTILFVHEAKRANVHLETFNSYERLVLYFQNAKNPLSTDISEWGEATSAILLSSSWPDVKPQLLVSGCEFIW